MRPHNNTLKLTLQEKLSGLIWKIKIHKSGLLAIETRNSDLKQVSFSVVNFLNGKVHFKEVRFTEPWNLGLAYLTENNLILNGYEHSESPESKGVISADVNTGAVIWERFNISLSNVHDGGLEVFDPRLQPRRYQWIDHLSAEPIANSGEMSEHTSILFPETTVIKELPSFIKHDELIGDIYELTFEGYAFVSFHERKGTNLQQRLVVYQADTIFLDDILIAGIQKLQPEAFFIQQNHLFYIRNKQEIISYLV